MTGRGRESTLPAWMTKENNLFQDNQTHNSLEYKDNNDRYKDESNNANASRNFRDVENRSSADGRINHKSEMSFRSERSRSRDDRRHHKTSRSRSRSKGRRDANKGMNKVDREFLNSNDNNQQSKPVPSWKSKTKSSNFDVKPDEVTDLTPKNIFGDIVPTGEGFGKRDLSVQTRHARRIYVGGIPPTTVENDMIVFFNDIIKRGLPKQYVPQGSPVVSVFLNLDKCFAFIELTSMEIASACQKLDGIQYKHHTGTYTLRMRRPHDYRPELVTNIGPIPDFTLAEFQVVSTTVTDGLGKVFIGGLPYHLTDEEVKELLTAFGPLKAFNLVRDPGSAITKGYAFCEYYDMNTTYMAVQGLNELQIGDKKLTVRVSDGKTTASSQSLPSSTPSTNSLSGMNFGPLGYLAIGNGENFTVPPIDTLLSQTPTRILKLENMVTSDELQDDEEYEDILTDVREECSQHGHVIQVIIPRVKSGYSPELEGSIYVEFADTNGSTKAAQNLYGRKFAERIVVVNYFNESKFLNGILI